jgi:hypothetical protein
VELPVTNNFDYAMHNYEAKFCSNGPSSFVFRLWHGHAVMLTAIMMKQARRQERRRMQTILLIEGFRLIQMCSFDMSGFAFLKRSASA